MMLRTPFEEELEKLHNQFYAMGTEVAAQLKKAVRAFISHDRDLAKEVIENDEIVNNYETKLRKNRLKLSLYNNLYQVICEQLSQHSKHPVTLNVWVTMP
ncbi:MAG: PhoU domain-containing protein [Streptococcus sp.]